MHEARGELRPILLKVSRFRTANDWKQEEGLKGRRRDGEVTLTERRHSFGVR